MKKIYLDVPGKTHSLYTNLINNPPEGYEFISDATVWGKLFEAAHRTNSDSFFALYRTLDIIIPVGLTKAYIERFKKIPKYTDLTYSASHLVFRKEPWVVDLEFVTQLTGAQLTRHSIKHFKKHKTTIEKILRTEYCKKIIPWTDAGRKTILWNLNCKGFEDKIETVHLAVRKKDFIKQYNEKVIKLLFVGSANIPKDFEIKGGKEVLEAFSQLNKKYDNLELVIRSYVPRHIKEKYKKLKNIKIIDKIIPWGLLEQEFKSCDIFLFPSHNTPGLAILDAMSYELPVITTDVWANPELVKDGENGFTIKKSEKIQYYMENFIPNWSSPETLKAIKNAVDPAVVNELVEKTSILIEDTNLRRMMGMAGRDEIETGRFSIEKRNEKLKRIFNEATEV
jgi:glycosyltransferase involved in cell wall biosynthesis